MKTQLFRFLVSSAVIAVVCVGAMAESVSELLEKAIYAEETVGDVDKAMTIYKRIVKDAQAARPHAAQACYRLGLCYQKKGEHRLALAAFDKLIERYPEQKKAIARARDAMAMSRRKLGPADVRSIVEKAMQDSEPMVVNNAEGALRMLGLEEEPSGTRAPTKKPAYSQTHRYVLQADGNGSHMSVASQRNRGTVNLSTYSFINSYNTIVTVLDEDDNELEFTVKNKGRHYSYTVTRKKPVPPGAEYKSKIVTRGKNLAKKVGGLWVYSRHHTPMPATDYTETVVLPAGAAIVSCDPKPTKRTTENGAVALRFEKNLRKREAFRCRIAYRLAGAAGGAGDALPKGVVELGYGDGSPDGKRSLGGSGHAVGFERSDTVRFIEGVLIHAARYGYPKAPDEDFELYVLDEEMRILATVPFAYGLVERGDLEWYTLRTPSIEVPETFHVALSFKPERTKGIYLGIDNSGGKSRSFTGLPGRGFSPLGGGQDWMVKVSLAREPSGARGVQRLSDREAPSPDGASRGAGDDLQILIDAARPGSVVNVPGGTYRKPLRIDKALRLKGVDRAGCVLEVTADEPAVLVTGKGEVELESLTIKWQRATSDRAAEPVCAVVVKDGMARISDCRLSAPGGRTRCPAAVLGYGFSQLHLDGCRFDGHEFTVQFAQGAEGTVEDCVFVNPGHCGVTVSSDSKAKIRGNVVTGSAYHAIRCTGGELEVTGNLIIKNKNRGVYLGNKSAKGAIRNNVILGNGTGISGFANSEVDIENNVILDCGYSGVDFRESCSLSVKNNIFAGNERGIVQFKEGGRGGTRVGNNTLWQNTTDTEGLDKTGKMLTVDPGFKDAANGDFTVGKATVKSAKHGLQTPSVFPKLWEKWKAIE